MYVTSDLVTRTILCSRCNIWIIICRSGRVFKIAKNKRVLIVVKKIRIDVYDVDYAAGGLWTIELCSVNEDAYHNSTYMSILY